MTTPTKAANVLPAAPYPVDSKHRVTIGGQLIDAYQHPSRVPDADCVVMAQYLRSVEDAWKAAGKPDSGPLGDAYVNLHHSVIAAVVDKGDRSRKNLNACATKYTAIVVPLKSVGSIPGSGVVTTGLGTLTDILKRLTSAALWLRVGEVLLGLLLIGVGASKLSGGVADKLSKIPVYGKAVPLP